MSKRNPIVSLAALVSLSLFSGLHARESYSSVPYFPDASLEVSTSAAMTPTPLKTGSILQVTGDTHEILNEISGNRLASIGGREFAAASALQAMSLDAQEAEGRPSEISSKSDLVWRKLPGPGIIRFDIPQGVRKGVLVVIDQEGREVRQLRPMGNNPAILWDGRNRSGKQMAGGVYRAELRSQGPLLTSWVLLAD